MRLRCVIMGLTVLLISAAAEADPIARLMAESCTVCHGLDGHGHTLIPSLAGKHPDEMMRALLGFRDGSRPATVMDRLVRGYDTAQLQAIVDELAASGGAGR